MVPWGDHPGIIENFGRSMGFSVEVDGFPMDFPMDLLLVTLKRWRPTAGTVPLRPKRLALWNSATFAAGISCQRSFEEVQPWAFVGISTNNGDRSRKPGDNLVTKIGISIHINSAEVMTPQKTAPWKIVLVGKIAIPIPSYT